MISDVFRSGLLMLLLLLLLPMMMMMKLVTRIPVAAAWNIRQGSRCHIPCLGNLKNNQNNDNCNPWDSLLLLQTQQRRSFHRMESRPNDYSRSQLKQSRRSNDSDNVNNFRNDFRGTRVFVQGIPTHISDWRLVKDHFKIAGEVVFASISIERNTGKSKGCVSTIIGTQINTLFAFCTTISMV